MRKCDFESCTGHLAKFDSCRDEALYQVSLEGFADDTTGDSDYRGYYALLVLPEAETLELTDTVSIPVEAGAYIVVTASNGGVSVARHDSEVAARVVFDAEIALYEQWYDQED